MVRVRPGRGSRGTLIRTRLSAPSLSSPVRIPAVADTQDIEPVSVIVKADAPVSDVETELGRMNAVELCVARTYPSSQPHS
jgi:hypothetical protein